MLSYAVCCWRPGEGGGGGGGTARHRGGVATAIGDQLLQLLPASSPSSYSPLPVPVLFSFLFLSSPSSCSPSSHANLKPPRLFHQGC